MSRKASGVEPHNANERGVPVDDYLFSESAFGASGADALPTGSSSGADALPTGSSSGAPKALTLGDLFVVLGSKRTSSKGRKKEAEAIKAEQQQQQQKKQQQKQHVWQNSEDGMICNNNSRNQ